MLKIDSMGEADTIEKAVLKALEELKANENEVNIEIIQEPKRAFLKSKNAIVKFDNTLRPCIFVNGIMNFMTDVQPVNLSAVIYCSKNDGISAGCYQGRIHFYSARGHNLFTVTLLKEM